MVKKCGLDSRKIEMLYSYKVYKVCLSLPMVLLEMSVNIMQKEPPTNK